MKQSIGYGHSRRRGKIAIVVMQKDDLMNFHFGLDLTILNAFELHGCKYSPRDFPVINSYFTHDLLRIGLYS
jgi:hypothetical protein